MTEPRPQSPAEYMALWAGSFRDYAKDLLKVQTVDGRLIPFELNNVQLALDDIINHIRSEGRLVRLVVDKLRRAGCSTYFAGRNWWLTNFNPHTYALMITHEPEATDTIFGMQKRFLANMPKVLRPQVLYDNRKALVFNTKDRVGGLDSEIKVGTAGKENLGSSQLCNFGHWSEFSKWPEHVIDALMTSLMPTIPDTPDSELILESTANGIGNAYHTKWLAARYHYEMFLDAAGELAWRVEINEHAEPGNTWSRVFIPWFVFDRCATPVAEWERQTGEAFVPTAEEEAMAATYFPGCARHVQLQKLAWYRRTLVDKFNNDKARMAQEYPTTWQESFISSGDAAFDTLYVQTCYDHARDEERRVPCVKYEVDPRSGQFVANPRGRLWVWEEAKPGEAYGIPADVAKGIVVDEKAGSDARHDFSVASVKHQLTGREVAQWHGKIDPDEFGLLLVALGRRYNNAWLIPENNNHGNTTITAILRAGYKKVYVERVIDYPNKPRKRYGFSMTGTRSATDAAPKGIRTEAVNALVARMRDKNHGIRSSRTFGEMLAFKRNAKGKFEAEYGHHDDCVVVEAIWAFAAPLLPLPAHALAYKAQAPLPAPSPPASVPVTGADGWA